MANTTKPIIDANALEAMAKERPNEKFLKGSGVLKLIQAIRDLERANRRLQAEQPTQIKNLRKALQFYADGHHFVMHDETSWDTVSGEPVNFYEDDAGTATVENGSIAKLALAGHPIKFEDEDAKAPAPAQATPAAPFNTETQDQIAAVMLQHGTEDQRRAALAYASGAAPAAGAVAGPDAVDLMILNAGAQSGNPGTLSLAAQLAGAPACTECGYVKTHCRCPSAAPTPAAQADSGEKVSFELYVALTDAMGYDTGKDGLEWSPKEWAAHLLASYRASKIQADSVLEDATRLEQIVEAIRDYHHALDMRKHGGLAESVAFNSICQTMGMTWSQGEEAARRAARKQGGAT